MINQLPSFPFQFSVTHQIILYVFHKEATALNFYSPLFKVSVLVHFNNEPSILREKWTSLILSVFRGIFWYFFSLSITQSCLTLCNPMDYTVHGILQARILEWVAFSFSWGSSQPRDQTQVSRIADRFITNWAIREAPKKRKSLSPVWLFAT